MLYEDFNAKTRLDGADVFKNKATEKVEVLKNLNKTFSIREYQKEALGRLYYYCEEYKQKQKPTHLMFNMATGSGKTLIMAANILYLYQKGYRNFIFFTRLGNIIQKTKANFLDPNSKKYLFSEKIILNGQQINVREVENFEGVNNDDINIVFSTTALLHSRFNFARENVLTYEDFADKKIVLIADEAHNLSAETNNRHTETEEEERRNWENTVMKILNANNQKENMLLEFTATARLEQEYPEILEKYKDKAIFRYDLKEYRLDGFSKDVRTLQINASLMERALSAVVISQYRRKIAEKHKIALKPVVMFKANRVTSPKNRTELQGDNPRVVVSDEFKESFQLLISNLTSEKLKQLFTINDPTLQMSMKFFKEQKISLENLVEEIKSDFAPEKCLSVDENKDVEQKQLLLNSLEDQNNEIRAVFATEKLNEGWDVLNLFDIVRLYNSRDADNNQPGKATVQEAQLIGRGARYCPFIIGEFTDPYRRKFDSDVKNELRIIEQLYYHSVTNSRYIQELESVLKREGIIPSHTIQRELKIKDRFKDKDFWKNGYIFLNKQEENLGKDVWKLKDAKAEFNHNTEVNIYSLPTREAIERDVFTGLETIASQEKIETKEFNIIDFGENISRFALSKLNNGRFNELKKIFGNLESVNEFINDENYLGKLKVKVKGSGDQLNNLLQIEKLKIATFVLEKVLSEAVKEKKEYIGTKEFKAHLINKIFGENNGKKTIQLAIDSKRAEEIYDFDIADKDWYAQDALWGTSEEKSFLKFIDGIIIKLQEKYQEIALLRNEQFFKIYNFEDGQPFSPDFVLFLKEKKSKKEIVYQVFIEPKGNEFFDEDDRFEKSKEGWKQKFLTEIEKQGSTELRLNFENQDYKLIGLPFYNEGTINNNLRKEFEEVFANRLLGEIKEG